LKSSSILRNGCISELRGGSREVSHRIIKDSHRSVSNHPPAIPALLAQPIVETCLRIPTWDWCRGGINRAITREAFSTALPAPVIARRSKSGPESLTAEVFELGRPVLRDLLLGGALRDNRIIDAAAVEAALDDPAVTRGQLLYRLLELAEAETWTRSWSERGSTSA
jgi:asparagine synthase (glutamine-hydrolysing)